jgi:hypothetical protein
MLNIENRKSIQKGVDKNEQEMAFTARNRPGIAPWFLQRSQSECTTTGGG